MECNESVVDNKLMQCFALFLTGPPPPLPPLQPAGMDAPPNSATSSVPTVVTTGIHHQPPPAPPSLFTAGVVLRLCPQGLLNRITLIHIILYFIEIMS